VSVTLIVSLCCGTPLQAQVQEHALGNGMKILVKEDHRAPVVTSMVWYRAGSIDEVNGSTGVAHVLEHMMFKGTKEVGPGEFSRIVARAGGRENAFTTKDSTVYHEQLHKSQLPLALRLEADRMANLLLSEEQFAREIKVVMEERRLRTDDQPKALLYEVFTATAYQVHPYRTPVVGWMTDLESITIDDLTGKRTTARANACQPATPVASTMTISRNCVRK
jgi:zinc protease